MKILVACEESQAVTKEFRRLGHEAYSCDIEPCSGGHPEWHIQDDVSRVIDGWRKVVYLCDCIYDKDDESMEMAFCPDCKTDYTYCPCPGPTMHDDYKYKEFDGVLYAKVHQWDMIIAFPPCTDLAVSGARYFKEKQADGRQQKAIDFFMAIANTPCNKIAIENPVGIMSTKWRKPDQIIQPYEYGHPESKKTCLWLKGLPLLKATNILPLPESGYWQNQTPSGQNKLGPSPERAKLRSKTYSGIARAMAEQWSNCSAEIQQELNC